MNDDKSLIEAIHKISTQAESLKEALRRWVVQAASPWISVNDMLPEDDQGVLVIVSGRPREHLVLDNAHELATFYVGEGWFFEAYPDWDDPQVTYWMPLPERPEDCHE